MSEGFDSGAPPGALTAETVAWEPAATGARPRRSRSRRYWTLLLEITRFQYRLKDQSTVLGFAWSFLNPLLVLAVLYVLFRAWAGRDIENYALYMLVGLVHFTHFSNATSGAMQALTNMRQLTCNTVLPKEVLVFGLVLSKVPEFAISVGICIAVAFGSGLRPGWSLALLPVAFAIQVLLTLWVSLLLAAAYVFVRDVAHVYQVFLRVLFIVTPTFYAAEAVGVPRLATLLNPLAVLIDCSRFAMLGRGPVPALTLAALAVANVVLLVAALAIFKRLEPKFAEYA